MATNQNRASGRDDANQVLQVLLPCDIAAIDHALGQIGQFGEVHLVIEKGRLRFIRTVTSQAVVRTIEDQVKGTAG